MFFRESGECDWQATNESIIQEILKIAEITIKNDQKLADFKATFTDQKKNVQFILSSEEEFAKIKSCCDDMQQFLLFPLKIEAAPSLATKIGVAVATLAGGAILAYIGGPGLIVIGAVDVISKGAVAAGATVGSLGSGYLSSGYLRAKMVDDKSYEQVLASLMS